MKTVLLISPYWREQHRWMVSSVKLAELWQRIGYKVVVLCMGHGEKGKAEKGGTAGKAGRFHAVSVEHVSETLTIHRVPDRFIPDPWNYGIAFGFSSHALRLARTVRPDVIIINKVLFWSSISLIRLRLAGFKTLLLTDALVGITWWPRGKVAQICAAIYANTLGWLILLFATKVVFFHPQPPKVLKRLGITKKSTVIPTGIDPAPYHAGKRSDFTGDVTVTYIGRLESVKGVDDFVAAALKIKKMHPELHVQVVGWFAKDHPLVAAHHAEVRFTGLSHDVPAVLADSDIFVMPSYSEGLSNALMEAMASGCACIASEVGGNAFLIQNGISGLLFDAGDREALASHIRRLVEDPSKRKSLGSAAQERIQNLFSWEKLGQEYTQLFDSWPAHSK